MNPTEKLRNIAIIAHVDHGKTSLLDAIRNAQMRGLRAQGTLLRALAQQNKWRSIRRRSVSLENQTKILVWNKPTHAQQEIIRQRKWRRFSRQLRQTRFINGISDHADL